MKLYAHQRHAYEDRANHRFYEWADGQVRDVPDDVGLMLLQAHPSKFCNVNGEESPESHVCSKTREYMVSTLEPEHKVTLEPGSGRVSAQRLKLRRQTLKRSRVARVNAGARG